MACKHCIYVSKNREKRSIKYISARVLCYPQCCKRARRGGSQTENKVISVGYVAVPLKRRKNL